MATAVHHPAQPLPAGQDCSPSYCINRRMSGYADNDGRYTVERVRGSYWSPIGVLTYVGDSAFLGVTDSYEQARALVDADAAELALAGEPNVWGNGQSLQSAPLPTKES